MIEVVDGEGGDRARLLGEQDCDGLNDSTRGVGPPYVCTTYHVNCQGLLQIDVILAERAAGGSTPENPEGLLLMFSGQGGESWWNFLDSTLPSEDAARFANGLNALGYELVLAQFVGASWMDDDRSPATLGGYDVVSCRPATVIHWVHLNLYDEPLGHQVGECGFCVLGHSGGRPSPVTPCQYSIWRT